MRVILKFHSPKHKHSENFVHFIIGAIQNLIRRKALNRLSDFDELIWQQKEYLDPERF